MKTQRTKRRGAAAIEFGLWLLPIAILVSGLVDLGWYMSRYHMVQRATMDGVRFGVRFGSKEMKGFDTQGSKQVAAANIRAQQMLDDFNVTGTPTASFHTDAPYDMLVVSTTAPFQPLVGIIPMPANIRSRFEMMAEIQWCPDAGPCP